MNVATDGADFLPRVAIMENLNGCRTYRVAKKTTDVESSKLCRAATILCLEVGLSRFSLFSTFPNGRLLSNECSGTINLSSFNIFYRSFIVRTFFVTVLPRDANAFHFSSSRAKEWKIWKILGKFLGRDVSSVVWRTIIRSDVPISFFYVSRYLAPCALSVRLSCLVMHTKKKNHIFLCFRMRHRTLNILLPMLQFIIAAY